MSKVRRLFEQFQPEHYQLELRFSDDLKTFSGTVAIHGKKTGRPSERLTFHQKGLKITDAQVTKKDKKGTETPVELARINTQETYDEVRLHAAEKIFPGDYRVVLQFEGAVTDPMNGIYPCYFDLDGKQQKLIATQFESHYAREAFPCIDEPEAKATFDLALVTPAANSKAVIANTPVRTTLPEAGKADAAGTVTSIFETTPRMSTYLLAFVFGDLDYLEATTKADVTVRTYATPANIKHTKFVLDVAVKCLDFYNDYFDTPYPLPKCDFIALPDFSSAAMENWGCITFREQAMLVDPANTSLSLKQLVANVVAHELTHQWFGNLVTMKWWNDLWLNESFASWMAYLATDTLFPEWDVWTQFMVDEQAPAFRLDSLANTHPINVTINHPDEIRTIFDAISYEKGASVLNMLRAWLGDTDFRDGLRRYLKEHAYGNTESADLWAAWEQVSHKPVGQFMTAWTTQEGYPIVHANITDTHETITQERFYLNPAAHKASDTWPVPLATGDNFTITLPTTEVDMTVPFDGVAILNDTRTSFARVVYNSEYLEKISQHLPGLPPVIRLGLLDDAVEAAKAGYGSTVDAFKLLEAYRGEDNLVVWEVMAGALGTAKMAMNDDTLRENMKPYIRELVAGQLERLGWDEKPDEPHFDTLLRPTILGLAAGADEAGVVTEALKRFTTMTKPEDIHPDIRSVVYATAARLGGQKEFDKLWAMHNASTNSEERVTLSAALTGFEHPAQIKQALEKVTTPDVRLQDAMYWIAYSFGNRFARAATWEWLKTNWGWLKEHVGDDLSFYRMPLYASRPQSDGDFLPEFKAFFASVTEPALERSINQGIETIEWQSAWRERDLAALQAYFAQHAD